MKQFHTLLMLLCCGLFFTLQAQDTRYVDPLFDVSVESNVAYGSNISILTGAPASQTLLMDVYSPVDDTETERPLVIYLHTGSFLPQYFNGGITGGKQDSTAVEICTRLAASGYVAVSATYRAGWLPTAPDQNVRTSTLLQASYRGIHDARTAIRFFRKTVAEDGNPYGIDPDKIVLWGQGTGGYLSFGAAVLDKYEEISSLDKFIDTETFEPYVLEARDGDVFGLNATPLNTPNWVDYESDFKLAVNMGGALGDTSWVDGTGNDWPEAAMIGFHVVTDPFAPFGDGPVIVPTTQEFVVQVQGTRTAVQVANAKGVNDALNPVLADTEPGSAFLNALVTAYSPIPIDLSALGQTPTTLAEPHMYPFITPGFRVESGPWDWWNKPFLDLIIAGVNQQFGTDFNADTLHANGLLTNPDMSAEKARAYIDTVMTYYNPRACQVLQLQECAIVDTEEIIDDTLIELAVAPNPATDHVFIRSNAAYPMEAVQVFDINGRFISAQYNIDNHQYRLDRGALPPGTYLIKVKFEEGISVRKVIFR